MSFWRKGNKKEKDEKSTSKSPVIRKGDGDVVASTATSFIRRELSISQTTEIHTNKVPSYSGRSSFNSHTSLNSQIGRISNASQNKTGLQRKQVFNNFISTLTRRKPTTNPDAVPFSSSNTFNSPPPLSAFSPYKTDSRRGSDGENNELRTKLTVEVVKSTKFYDDQKQSKVPVYPTRSKHRGKLLIINNIKFGKFEEREGAEVDEENAVQLFQQMRFEVVRWENLNQKEMEKNIISFRSDTSLKKYDIVTVIIMSHGTGKERNDSTEVACTDDKLLPTTWITNQFNDTLCPQLKGKPKIFIFQCCRGGEKDKGKPKIFIFQCCRGGDYAPNVTDLTNLTPTKLSDMLIAYSTVPGFVSHRNSVTGTWYIQAICKVFREHAHNTDVESLLKIVDNKLERLISKGSKQTSSFENRSFRTCFLHPQLYE